MLAQGLNDTNPFPPSDFISQRKVRYDGIIALRKHRQLFAARDVRNIGYLQLSSLNR